MPRFALPLPPRDAAPFDVVGVGENCLDLVAVIGEHPRPDSKVVIRELTKMAGGQVATAMVAVARLGWRARYVGYLGTDEHAKAIEEALRRDRVDVAAAVRLDGPNQTSVILVDAGTGRRTVLSYRPPTFEGAATRIDPHVVTSGRVVLVDATDVTLSTAAAAWARQASRPTVVDVEVVKPGIDDLLRHIDVMVVAETFPGAWSGDRSLGMALRALDREFQPALIVATLGSEGSLALYQGSEIKTPGFVVPVVDTIGAGDAFRGGLMAAWLAGGEGSDLAMLLERANATAALNCRAPGAQAGLPVQDEVDVLVTRRGAPKSNPVSVPHS